MEMKVCIKCEIEFPITNEYFSKAKGNKDGLKNICKKCDAKWQKQYREAHKEIVSKWNKQYKEKHKEYTKQYVKQYNKTHKEYFAKYHAKYHTKYKEIICERSRQYSKKNRDKRNILNQYRKSKERKLSYTLTNEQWKRIKQCFNNECAYCGRTLKLTQDHVIPLSKDGEYGVSNIVPACGSCNSSKHDKDFKEWYPKYKYYSKKREKAILEFLGYKDNEQQLSII